MDNYVKGKCVEEPLDRNRIPLPNLPDNFLWMQVKGGSKVSRLLEHASSLFKTGESKTVVWTGSGDGVLRAISCAEAMKRHLKIAHQITKIGYRKCEEFWEPQLDGLERLVVNREIPIIHILLSIDPVDTSEPGYQSLDNKNAFWKSHQSNQNTKKKPNKNKSKVTPEEIAAMGLQTSGTKNIKKKPPGHGFKKKTQSEKS